MLRYDWGSAPVGHGQYGARPRVDAAAGRHLQARRPGASLGSRLTYALAEIETHGGVRVHGPYEVPLGAVGAADVELSSDGKGRARMPKAKMLKRLAKHRAKKNERRPKKSSFASAIRVHVKESGLYFVDAARIAEVFGFGLDRARG